MIEPTCRRMESRRAGDLLLILGGKKIAKARQARHAASPDMDCARTGLCRA
jgi:hypothetical protein